jgi:uncharacterized membrane protein HdeD (DUF308 family)
MTAHTEQETERLLTKIQAEAERSLKAYWIGYTIEGALMCAIGAAAVVLPQVAGVAIDVFIGWLLFLTGLVSLITRLAHRSEPAFWSGLAVSLLTLALGLMLAVWPVAGVVTLSMALVAFFIAQGLGMVILAASMRVATTRWFWVLMSALVDFVLAGLVLAQWPQSTQWLLGLYFGINLMLTGLGLAFAALGSRIARS